MTISTIADIARHWARETPDSLALVFDDRRWTYADLDAESSRAAQALVQAGVRPGDRVAFLDKNVPEYFLLLLGGAKVGAVGVAVNWRLAPPEMQYILDNAEAKVLVIGESFLGHLEKMDLPHVTEVVVIGDPGTSGHQRYDEWIARQPATDPGYRGGPDETCYQLYTSGTTGLPKGVELTNDNFFSMLPTAVAAWKFDQQSVSIVCMPLFHIAGSGWGLVALYTGGTDILQREVDPSAILAAIAEHRVTNALFVPAVLQFLLATPGAEDVDFSSLRSIQYGASPISEDVLVRSLKLFGTDLVQVYGLTETTGAVTLLPAEDHDPGGPRAHLLRSCGRPWAGCEVRIVDPATLQDVPEGEVGEIWIRGRQVMKGYWRNPEATAEAKPGDGWFRSGDAGYLRDGYVYIHDRVKDMVISGGENIYPAEIENVLMKHPDVADAAVIGVPSERWGETVKAIVVRAPQSTVDEAALIAYCRENLAHYKCPTSVDWAEALPRNPSGKILKTELREPYWRDHERRVS